jgi:hypothetical protein
MDALAGEQTGEVQKKFVNRIPSAARESIPGVMISLFPAHPIAHAPWSSESIKTIFGLWGSLLANFCFLLCFLHV